MRPFFLVLHTVEPGIHIHWHTLSFDRRKLAQIHGGTLFEDSIHLKQLNVLKLLRMRPTWIVNLNKFGRRIVQLHETIELFKFTLIDECLASF